MKCKWVRFCCTCLLEKFRLWHKTYTYTVKDNQLINSICIQAQYKSIEFYMPGKGYFGQNQQQSETITLKNITNGELE